MKSRKRKKTKERFWIKTKFLCLSKPQKLLLGRRLTVEIVLFFFGEKITCKFTEGKINMQGNTMNISFFINVRKRLIVNNSLTNFGKITKWPDLRNVATIPRFDYPLNIGVYRNTVLTSNMPYYLRNLKKN